MSDEHAPRTLLLVDDEPNMLNALRRALRPEGYRILAASGGGEALDLLAREEVGVIVSDQRMPEMTGVEFLSRVKTLYPKTVRIVLSGYTELESVTNAINQGAVYKFLTKPWEDELLRENIREAFRRHEMERENLRLAEELRRANEALARLNRGLQRQVWEKTEEITHNVGVLQVSQEILEHLPLAVIGIDETGMIAVSNRRADALLRSADGGPLLGESAERCLPGALLAALRNASAASSGAADGGTVVLDDGARVQWWFHSMGDISRSKGMIVVLSAGKGD
jgi:response regulator RpfG family c-di-GMP phosphodiesterase